MRGAAYSLLSLMAAFLLISEGTLWAAEAPTSPLGALATAVASVAKGKAEPQDAPAASAPAASPAPAPTPPAAPTPPPAVPAASPAGGGMPGVPPSPQAIPPSVLQENAAPGAPVTLKNGALPVAESPAVPEVQIFTNTSYKSLLFRESDVERIKEAGEAYKLVLARKRLEKDYVTQPDASPQPLTRIIDHPQFYLASIIFHGKDDWSVWINGIKYTAQQPSDSDLIVQDVDRDKAKIIWRPTSFTYYKDKPAGGGGQPVVLDAAEGTITFTLYPNQTFSAFTLKIHEGMLPSVYREQINTTPLPQGGGNSTMIEPNPAAAKAPVTPAVPVSGGSALTRPDSELPQATLGSVPTFSPPQPPGLPSR